MADNDQGWRQWVNSLPKMEATTEQATGFQPAPAGQPPFSVGMLLQPQFDPLELLPPAAAEKLRQLRQRSADAHAVIPEFEQIREASLLRVESENALRRLTGHPQEGGFNLKPDDRRVTAAQRTLDKATDDFERIKQRSKDRTAAWHAAGGALSAIEAWLKSGRPGGTALEDYEVEPPKLVKGEAGLLDAIENRRRRVRELRADLHRIASAPYPSKHVKARMRAAIEALAMQGPDVSMMVEHDGGLIWPLTRLRSEVLGAEHPALAFTEVPDAVALIAWLHRDALIKRLDAEIDTEADDAAALSHEARQKAEAEVQSDLLAVERDESALVFRAWTDGLPCEHRSDCSPLALLGLRLVTAPRADLPPTSPEHVITFAGGRR